MMPITQENIAALSDAELEKYERELLRWEKDDRRENGLLYYSPNNDSTWKIHRSHAKIIGIFGGNRSGKTECVLAELACLATGTIPEALKGDEEFLSKFRGPISIRVVCVSITTTLHQVMLRKLNWQRWNGDLPAGGPRGHYGWIPKDCLVEGDWNKSWSEKLRTLRVLYRDPLDHATVLGESSIQFMSHDQESETHASAEFHAVMLDEPPPYDIWEESMVRVMSVGGRIYLSMTWPSDPSFNCEWIHDSVYERGQPGPNKDPNVDIVNIYTTQNPHIDQAEVSLWAGHMTDNERKVRIYGQPIRFSNRVHPLWTDQPQVWCFVCRKVVIADHGRCGTCLNEQIVEFCHFEAFTHGANWPVILLLDPHPRKAHCLAYWQVDPHDDLWCLGELEVAEPPAVVKQRCDAFEAEHRIEVVQRLMDPNMGRSPSGTSRELTWQDEFSNVGLPFDLADDSDVGRGRVNEYLEPNPHTKRPRMTWHTRCTTGRMQFKRFCWDDYKKADEREQKQKPKPKHDDFPALARYLLNSDPSFRALKSSGMPVTLCGTLGEKGY